MPSHDELVAAFQKFDTDGSNTLSAEELTAILTRGMGAMSVAEAQALIKSVDVNGDGELCAMPV